MSDSPAAASQSDQSAAAPPSTSAPTGAAAGQSDDVQPLPEQMPTQPRQSPPLATPLDVLAKVELQLCLQYLDSRSKLVAARCSRRLLQAADDPFAWCGSPVSVSSSNQPQLVSLIRRSLLRHAPIALSMDGCGAPLADVAAIPNLRHLRIPYDSPEELILQLLALQSLQGLQVLRAQCELSLSALQLLPTLPALHALDFWDSDCADWRWLPLMPTLTDLRLMVLSEDFPPPLVDGIGQCTRLQSLRLEHCCSKDGAFLRLCSTPALRQLRHLWLVGLQARDEGFSADECRAAFSALVQLESLHLERVNGADLLLAHLVHAPALRTLTIPCSAIDHGRGDLATHPSRSVLCQLLNAAPLLEVRLHMASSIADWRDCWMYQAATTPAEREQCDEQWRELQRVAEQLERVTIVDRAVDHPIRTLCG